MPTDSVTPALSSMGSDSPAAIACLTPSSAAGMGPSTASGSSSAASRVWEASVRGWLHVAGGERSRGGGEEEGRERGSGNHHIHSMGSVLMRPCVQTLPLPPPDSSVHTSQASVNQSTRLLPIAWLGVTAPSHLSVLPPPTFLITSLRSYPCTVNSSHADLIASSG